MSRHTELLSRVYSLCCRDDDGLSVYDACEGGADIVIVTHETAKTHLVS